MTKTLKDLFEVYRPKAKGEQDFVDKHVTIKHKDRNGNKDDVFKATNIKTVDRETEHGYNPGNDEKVYEDVEQIDELSDDKLLTYAAKATRDPKRREGVLKATHKALDGKYPTKKEMYEAVETGIKEYYAELGEEISDEDLDALVNESIKDLSAETPKANIFEHNFKNERKSKADIVSSIVEKYAIVKNVQEEISEENELINKLVPHLSEASILRIVKLYEELDEENKEELFNLVETKEGINDLLNFMIESSYSDKNEEEE